MAGPRSVGTGVRPTTTTPKVGTVGATPRPGAVKVAPGAKPIIVGPLPIKPSAGVPAGSEGFAAGYHHAEDIFDSDGFVATGNAFVDLQIEMLDAMRRAEEDAAGPKFFQPAYRVTFADGSEGEFSGPPIFTEDTGLEMSAARGGGSSNIIRRDLPRSIEEFRALPVESRRALIAHWGRLAGVSIDLSNASNMDLAFAYDYLNDIALITCPEMLYSTQDFQERINPIRYGIHAHHYLTLREIMISGDREAFYQYLEENLEDELSHVLPMISVGLQHRSVDSLLRAITKLEGTEYAWLARLLLIQLKGEGEKLRISHPSMVFSDSGRIIMHPIVDNMTIGRHPDSDVVISDSHISRKHAIIRYDMERQGYYIVHTGTHPTWIHRDHRIIKLNQVGQREFIFHGDILNLAGKGIVHVVIPGKRELDIVDAQGADGDEILMTVVFDVEANLFTPESSREVPQPKPAERSENAGPTVIVDTDGLRHGRGTRPPRRSSDPNGRIRRGAGVPQPAPIPFESGSRPADPRGTQGISAADREGWSGSHLEDRPFDASISAERAPGRRSPQEEFAAYLASDDPQEAATQIVYPKEMVAEREDQAGRRRAITQHQSGWERFKAFWRDLFR